MTIQAKIIEDSISHAGKRITTFQLLYPRFIHAELLTHRVFSRNASSSRAIPVSKMLAMVRDDPAMPIHWGKNQPGMQAKEELLLGDKMHAERLWKMAAIKASQMAEDMMKLGLHKQVANRILEPFQHISVVLTATDFSNWFELRAHPDAQPEIQALAVAMREVMEKSSPVLLNRGEWHLPYVTQEERNDGFFKANEDNAELLRKVSAARCCRVSYLTHQGRIPSINDDLNLCEKLVGARPLHASPFEHVATPLENPNQWSGNFQGWFQYRKEIEAKFK
jgi:thymidylate synthase ThyX